MKTFRIKIKYLGGYIEMIIEAVSYGCACLKLEQDREKEWGWIWGVDYKLDSIEEITV